MRKTIRIFLSFILVLSFAFYLVGCGKKTNPSTTTKDATQAEITTTKSGGNASTTTTTASSGETGQRGDTTVYFHYLRYKGDYTDWDLWVWEYRPVSGDGFAVEFKENTDPNSFGGVYAEIPVSADITQIGFIIRKGGLSWVSKDISRDRYIEIPNDANEDNPVHVYVQEATVDFSVNEAPIVPDKYINAKFTTETTIVANATKDIDLDSVVFYCDNQIVPVKEKSLSADKMTVYVTTNENVNYTSEYKLYSNLVDNDDDIAVTFEGLYDYQGFNDAFNYDGELGAIINEDGSTTFRVWAPVSTKVVLNWYQSGVCSSDDDGAHKGNDYPFTSFPMTKGEKGTWSYTTSTNQHGRYYTYSVTTGGVENEVIDPYAKACGVNGRRGLVVDFSKINPEGWTYGDRADVINKNNDAVIYEMHVRDMTIDETWNGKSPRGTFKALAESGTTYNGLSTGFDHIKELGVNTVQILPFFDWSDEVDESRLYNPRSEHYSWGYMPLNYNCLEGSYSTDPYDGFKRIVEFKEMVMAYTEAGIRINMDVVYNHVANAGASSFDMIVPNYYFRTDADGNLTNGSGCGNETASERYMMSKFMVDSCTFWAYEYNLSGFRFDLMGLHDTDTMNKISASVRALDPTIMLYGEPWTGDYTPLPGNKQAKTDNINNMPTVGTFNDSFRDAVKGNVSQGDAWGWVQGYTGDDNLNKIKSGITGTFSYNFGNPQQVLNYVACHDNNTLHDKLDQTTHDNIKWTEAELIAMVKESYALVMLSQGIPFLLNGDEFMRDKTLEDGSYDHNSVHSGDEVNGIDWSLKEKYLELNNFIKALIKLRNEHPSFRLSNNDEIGSAITFYDWGDSWIVFKLHNENDSFKNILVVMNNAKETYNDVDISSISGNWIMVLNPNGLVTSSAIVTKFATTINGVYVFKSN